LYDCIFAGLFELSGFPSHPGNLRQRSGSSFSAGKLIRDDPKVVRYAAASQSTALTVLLQAFRLQEVLKSGVPPKEVLAFSEDDEGKD
jgi:hypothetical protein